MLRFEKVEGMCTLVYEGGRAKWNGKDPNGITGGMQEPGIVESPSLPI